MTSKLGFVISVIGFGLFFVLMIVFLSITMTHGVALAIFCGIVAITCLIMMIVAACCWYDETGSLDIHKERLKDYYNRKIAAIEEKKTRRSQL